MQVSFKEYGNLSLYCHSLIYQFYTLDVYQFSEMSYTKDIAYFRVRIKRSLVQVKLFLKHQTTLGIIFIELYYVFCYKFSLKCCFWSSC